MKVIQKPPTLASLIESQKQQNKALALPPSPKQKYFKTSTLQTSQQANPWQSIHSIINTSEQEAAELKKLPLKYSNAQREHEIDQLRNQVSRSKLGIRKLEVQRDRARREEGKAERRLELLLDELDRVQGLIQDKGYQMESEDNSSVSQSVEDAVYPELYELMRNTPEGYVHKYLTQVNNSDSNCKPIDFFNILSSRVMETDRTISFLLNKKYQQESTIESLKISERNQLTKEPKIQNELVELQQKQKSLKMELSRIENELQHIRSPNYIDEELTQRIEQQKILHQEECTKLYMNVMKLWKLIELSGNREAIGEAEQVMGAAGIHK